MGHTYTKKLLVVDLKRKCISGSCILSGSPTSRFRGTYLRKVLAVRGLQGLVGRLQKLLRALQSSRAGSQLVLQVPWHREKRHLTPLPQALPGLPTAFRMQGTLPFSNCRWEREAGPLQAGHQNHLGIPSLEMHMPRPHLSPGLHIPQGWESGVLGVAQEVLVQPPATPAWNLRPQETHRGVFGKG